MALLDKHEAEAIKATAQAANTGLTLLDHAGSWTGKVLGTLPGDVIGLIGGDFISNVRRRNLAKYEAKTEKLLEGIQAERRNEPSPSLLLPLLADALNESREELQDLWAALLARSLIDDGRGVRRVYFEIVKNLEPADAILLKALMSELFVLEQSPPTPAQIQHRHARTTAFWARLKDELGEDEVQVSIEELARAGLIISNDNMASRATRLGKCFFEAVTSELR